MVFEHPRVDDYCLAYRPEVFFLPHLDYKRLNQEIRRSRCLREYSSPCGIRRKQSTPYTRNDLVAAFDRCNATRRARPRR